MVENFIVFRPLILSHNIGNIDLLVEVAIGFTTFGLVAFSGYLVNELLDIESDRAHPTKCRRPFVIGRLSLRFEIIASFVLLFVALTIGAAIKLCFPSALVVLVKTKSVTFNQNR